MNESVRFPLRFFLVTFIWSWVLWTPFVLVSFKIISMTDKFLSFLTLPIIIIGAFGPLVGALFILHQDDGGKGSAVKYLQSFFDIHLGWKAYVFPLVILGGSTFIAWFLPELFGEKRQQMLLPSIWVFIPYLLIMIFLGGGQEEFGWRGYALPLLERQFGVWFANIILGIIWAFWHLPLWFITGTSQTYMNFGGFILLTVGYSFIFSWIRKISGNRPFSGLYTHGFANAFIPLMPIIVLQKDVPQQRFWIWVILTFLIGISITIFRKKNNENILS